MSLTRTELCFGRYRGLPSVVTVASVAARGDVAACVGTSDESSGFPRQSLVLRLEGALRVLLGVVFGVPVRRAVGVMIGVVRRAVGRRPPLGQPSESALVGLPVTAIIGADGVERLGGWGLVVPWVLLALALLALLLTAALSRLGRCRRRLKRRLVHLRRRFRAAAARRRETSLVRRAKANCAEIDWNLDRLKRRVKDAFDPIQARWRVADVGRARAYLSDAFYVRHERELKQLEARHQIRRIVVSSLDDVEIVAIEACGGDAGRVVAHVRFSGYETLSDCRSARIIEGVPGRRRVFCEYWTLVVHPAHGWVIDDIERRHDGQRRGRALVARATTLAVRAAGGATGALRRGAEEFGRRGGSLRLLSAPRARRARKRATHAEAVSAGSPRTGANGTATIAPTETETGDATLSAFVDGDHDAVGNQQVKIERRRRR